MHLHHDVPQPIRILLVEDSGVQALVIRAAVAELPHLELVHVATDGVEAIEYLRGKGRGAKQRLPDVVLLDLNMPRRNGLEVLAELKADHLLRRIPIVLFSTSTAQEDIDRAYDEGANSYIVKPVNLNDLKNVLDQIAHYWGKVACLPTSARSPRRQRRAS